MGRVGHPGMDAASGRRIFELAAHTTDQTATYRICAAVSRDGCGRPAFSVARESTFSDSGGMSQDSAGN